MYSDEKYELTFCDFAMCLFRDTGHTDASSPIYANHSSNQAMYFDSQKNIALSRMQREILSLVSNISLLFELTDNAFEKATGKKVAFYSVTTHSTFFSRSQDAHNVHFLLRQYWNCAYSVVVFNYENSVILSFADETGHIMLSDWYNIDSELDNLLGRLDISNVSLNSADTYLSDLIYALVRWYYIHPISPEEASYSLLPIDYFSSLMRDFDQIDREETKETIRSILRSAEDEYTTDYVDPDDQDGISAFNFEAEIDLLGLELEIVNDDGFETILDDEDDYDEDDESEDGDAPMDEYLFENVDPEIFNDPTLMVKWLERIEKEESTHPTN